MVAEVSHLRGSTGKGISELSPRTAGSSLQGREAGFATLHFCKSLCCKNYFLLPAEFFCKNYKHCKEQPSSVACFCCCFGGWTALSLSHQGWRCFSVLPSKTRRSFSVTFRVRVVVALKLCWMLPWCHAVSQQGVLLWRLPSFSALTSHCPSSSFSLRNNGLVWSIHCTFLMSQMQRALFFFFFSQYSFCTVGVSESGTEMWVYRSCVSLTLASVLLPVFPLQCCTGAQGAEGFHCAGSWTNIAERQSSIFGPSEFLL